MPRHIVVTEREGRPVVMDESEARNEEELQLKMRDHPELLPVEELDLGGSMMVIGRETVLPSGRPDLLGLSVTGDLIIVEMKTGPQNSDFRRALAQLVDYGADLWGASLEEFEERYAVPYFTSSQCPKWAKTKGSTSIADAITANWPADVEADDLLRRLAEDLRTGAFTYVLAAQSLTDPMERSMDYLNAAMKEARFFGVELVKFEERDGRLTAFEGRTVVAPRLNRQTSPTSVRRAELLARFPGDLRPTVEQILDTATNLGLTIFYGVKGASIKVQLRGRDAPVSIVWLYPPGSVGYKGSRELTLGFDRSTAPTPESSLDRLNRYAQKAGRLSGAPANSSDLDASIVGWEAATPQLAEILEALEQVAVAAPEDERGRQPQDD